MHLPRGIPVAAGRLRQASPTRRDFILTINSPNKAYSAQPAHHEKCRAFSFTMFRFESSSFRSHRPGLAAEKGRTESEQKD